jgi:hypothetical protein
MSAQKYLVMLRSNPGKQESSPSAAELEEMYAALHEWKETFKANIVDMGAKLQSSGRIVTSSGVTDGPFVEAKQIVRGFMILAAESYDQAVDIAGRCPALALPGSSIEIREIASR